MKGKVGVVLSECLHSVLPSANEPTMHTTQTHLLEAYISSPKHTHGNIQFTIHTHTHTHTLPIMYVCMYILLSALPFNHDFNCHTNVNKLPVVMAGVYSCNYTGVV